MKAVLKSGLYIWHPVFMPVFASLFYFFSIPQLFPESIIKAKLLAIAVLSIFVPLVFIFFMKRFKLIKTLENINLKAIRLLLLCVALLIITINNFILGREFPELYSFFVALLLSFGIIFLLSFANFLPSLHSTTMSALLGFVVGMGLLYKLNVVWLIAVLVFALGWVSTARLIDRKHTLFEVSFGFFIGILPQALIFLSALVYYKM